MPKNVQSWIYTNDSLTQRLRSYYGQSVAVEILFQSWRPAFMCECQLLKLPSQRYSLIREVLLHANGKPLVIARTILPAKTIKIAKHNLSRLGNRPLGEVIFSYRKLKCLQLNISQTTPNIWTQKLQQKVQFRKNIWGRSTLYAICKQQLLVSEFFCQL